jgi:EAL domain-containing protein (putative c-di-GMP-specific phosphodiesterase class I)
VGKIVNFNVQSIVGHGLLIILKYFSVALQEVVDADKKFIAMEVGTRGKQTDGGSFSSSTLFQLLQKN